MIGMLIATSEYFLTLTKIFDVENDIFEGLIAFSFVAASVIAGVVSFRSGSPNVTASFYAASAWLITGLCWLIITIPNQIASFSERPAFRSWFSFGQGGKARWAGTFSLRKIEVRGNAKGIFLGRTLFQDTVGRWPVAVPVEDDAHFVTIAATGSGKSVTAIWPTIKNYDAPAVVLDPKGEHAAFSAKDREYSIILDPYRKSLSSNPDLEPMLMDYNPLHEIDITDDHARALIQAIGSACVMEESGDNIHFAESAKTIIEGVIVHVLTNYSPEEQTLPKVADMFRGFDSEIGASDPKTFDNVIVEMSANNAAGGLAMDAAGLLLSAGDRERGSMLTTCFRSLKWVNDPPMRQHLSSTSLDHKRLVLENIVLSYGKETVFLVLPFEYMDKSSQIRWMRMMVNLLNVHLFRNPRGEKKLLLVLDEFFKLGYMPSLEEGIVTARGAGMKYWILIQNISQLQKLYGDNWETFLGSSNVQLFGVSDDATAKWAAAAIGGERDRETGQYSLMRPDEVRQFLGKDLPVQIVIPVNGAPMRLERVAYKPLKQYRGI